MEEYISRETIRRTVLNYNPENPKKATCWAMMITDLLRDIDNLPAADVQSVKHGKWDTHDVVKVLCSGKTLDGFCQCEACGDVFPLAYSEYNYCPRCGAKMDGDAE